MDITKAYSTGTIIGSVHPNTVNTSPQSFESKVGGGKKSRRRKSQKSFSRKQRKSRKHRR